MVDLISRLMLFLAIAAFGFTLVNVISINGFGKNAIIILAFITGIIGWWAYCYNRQKKGIMPFYRFGLLIATCGWIYLGGGINWIVIIYFFAVISEKQVKFPQEVAFDEKEIVFNTLPKKYYYWSNITNVVLKDGILTIDFKNNKLIQKEIETQTSVKEEQEFNEFCFTMLKAQS